jgi:hypothetical protein
VRINRTLIARAVLTLGAVGSVMAGTVAPIWASASPAAVAVASHSTSPDFYYNG